MYSQKIRLVMQGEHLLTATSETTVRAAAHLLAGSPVGAIVVVDECRVVGIFTERDAVLRVLAPGADAQATVLAQVMTRDPLTIDPDQLYGQALRLMHERGFRHLPVVEDGKPVGIVCARDALDPELEEFVCEAKRREALG